MLLTHQIPERGEVRRLPTGPGQGPRQGPRAKFFPPGDTSVPQVASQLAPANSDHTHTVHNLNGDSTGLINDFNPAPAYAVPHRQGPIHKPAFKFIRRAPTMMVGGGGWLRVCCLVLLL